MPAGRPRLPKKALRYSLAGIVTLSLLMGAAACSRKARVPTAKPPPQGATQPGPVPPAAASLPPASTPVAGSSGVGPLVRIGLTTTSQEVHISAPGEFYLLEKVPEAARQVLTSAVQVRLEREARASSQHYRVQVAALTRREAAEDLARKLSELFRLPAVVRESAATGTHQVRLGSFPSRDDAQVFASGALAQAGYRDSLVVSESGESQPGEKQLALHGPNLLRLSRSGFIFQPASTTAFLRVDGKPYRGILDLEINSSGRITVVNQLGLEEYLPGVVPAEMSPALYPEFAALAAQAIAARTYALRLMGRFASEGFDLTADTRTQVYLGAAQEREASSEAVRRTYGVALYYQGAPIDAMYTSTCGGRTEDFSNVFDATPVPYLRSVACTAESGIADGLETVVEGHNALQQVLFVDDGTVANRNLELAQVLGISAGESFSAAEAALPAGAGEIRGWIDQTRLALGERDAVEAAGDADITTRAGFIRYVAERLYGRRKIESRTTGNDTGYFLANLKDGADVPPEAGQALAFAMQLGLWQPYPDNTARPLDPVRRGDALSLLIHWLESLRPDILREGFFERGAQDTAAAAPGGSILVRWGQKTREFPLSDDVRLFRLAEDRSIPADSVRLIGNERLRFHVGIEGKIDFLEVELNPSGTASDRSSPVSTWTVTLARATVDEKLRSLAKGAGQILDLRVAREGNSGRAVQVEVVGSRSSLLLNGYRVRGALGLRDTLYTLRRKRDPSGAVESFTFDGRGWGHGVGMCQVGASGMARAGRSYEEILKTYYQGADLRRAY